MAMRGELEGRDEGYLNRLEDRMIDLSDAPRRGWRERISWTE